jgi:hypothetical protein
MLDKDSIDNLTLVIATCALVATFWQGYLARVHNRLIVRPVLVWSRSRDISGEGVELTFAIENTGVGPAIVTEQFFTVSGERFVAAPGTDEIRTLIDQLLGQRVRYQLRRHGFPAVNAAFPAGRTQVIVCLFFPGISPQTVDAHLQSVPPTAFHVRYESLYGETRWCDGGDLSAMRPRGWRARARAWLQRRRVTR